MKTCFLAYEWAGLDQELYCRLLPDASPTQDSAALRM